MLFAVDGFVDGIHAPLCVDLVTDVADIGQFTKTVYQRAHEHQPTDTKKAASPLLAAPVESAPDGGAVTCYNLLVKSVVVLCLEDEDEVVRLMIHDMELIYSTHRTQAVNINGAIGSLELLDVQNTCAPQIITTITERPLLSLFVSREVQSRTSARWQVSITCTGYLVRYRAAFVDRLVELCSPRNTARASSTSEWSDDVSTVPRSSEQHGQDGSSGSSLALAVARNQSNTSVVMLALDVTNVKIVVVGPSPHVMMNNEAEMAGHFHFQRLRANYENDDAKGFTSLDIRVEDGRYTASLSDAVDFNASTAALRLLDGHLVSSRAHRESSSGLRAPFPRCWYTTVTFTEPTAVLTDETLRDLLQWLDTFSASHTEQSPAAQHVSRKPTEKQSSKQALTFSLRHPNVCAVANGQEIFRLEAKRFDIHISSGVPSRENGTTFTLFEISGTAPAPGIGEVQEVIRVEHTLPEERGWALQCELRRPQSTAAGGLNKSTVIRVGSVWIDVVPFATAAARLHVLVAHASPPSSHSKATSASDSTTSSSQGIRLEGTVASAKAVARLRPDDQELEIVALTVRAATVLNGSVLLGLDCSCERTYAAYSNPQAIIGQQMVLADMFGACCKLHQGGRGQAVLYTDVDLIKLRLPLVEVHSVSQLLFSLAAEFSAATGDVAVLPRSEGLFTGRVLCGDALLPLSNTLQTSPGVEATFVKEEGGYRITGPQSDDAVTLSWSYAVPHRVTSISWKAAASSRATRPLFASLYFFNGETQQYEVAVSVLPANTLSQSVTACMADLPSSCSWRLLLHSTDRRPCETSEPFPALMGLRLLAIPTPASTIKEDAAVPRPLLTFKATVGSVEMATMTMHTTDSPLFVLQCDTSRLEVKLARTSRGLTATGEASLSATLVYQDFQTLRLEEVLCAEPQASFCYTRHSPSSGLRDRLTVHCTLPASAPQLTVRVTRPLVQLMRNATSFLQHHGQLQGTSSVGMFYHYRVHNCTNALLVLRDMACPDAPDFVVVAGATRYFKWNLSPVPQQQRRFHVVWGASWKSGELNLTNSASTRWFRLSPLDTNDSQRYVCVEQRMALVVTAPPVADSEDIHVSRVYDAFFCLSHKMVNLTDLCLRMRFSHPSESKTREQSLPPTPAASAFATLATDGQQRVSVGVGDGASWSAAVRLRDTQFASLIRCYDATCKSDRYFWLTVNRECMGNSMQRVESDLSFVVLTVSPVYQLVNQSPLPMHWRLQHGDTVEHGTVAAEAEVAFYCSPRKVAELFVAAVLVSSADLLPTELAGAEQLEWSGALALEGVASREHHLSTGRGWVAPAAFVRHIHMYVRQTVAATIYNSRRLCLVPLQLLQNDTKEVLWVGQVSPTDKTRMLDCVRLGPGSCCPYAFSFPNETPTSLAVFRCERVSGREAEWSSGTEALSSDAALAVDDVDTILGVDIQHRSGTYLAGYVSKIADSPAVVNHQYVAVATVEACGQARLRLLPPLILQNDTSFGLALCLGDFEENAAAHACYAAPGESVHLHHWAAAGAQVQQLLRCVNLRLSGEGWSWKRVDLSESRREALLAEDSSAEAVTACAWRNAVSGEEAGFHLLLLPQEKGCLRLCFVDAPPLPFRFINAVPHRLHCRLSTSEEEEPNVFSLHPGAALSIAAASEGATLALRLDEQHTWSSGVPLDRPRSAVVRLYGQSGSIAVEVVLAFHGSDALVRFLHQPICDPVSSTPRSLPPVQSALPFLSIPDAHSVAGMALVAGRPTSVAGPGGGMHSVLELELPALVLGLAAEQEDCCKEVAQVVATSLRLHVRPRGSSAALDLAASCSYLAVRDGSDPEQVVVEWSGQDTDAQAITVDVTLPLPSCQLLRRLAVRFGPLQVALDDRFVRRLLKTAPRWLNALTRPTLVDSVADVPQQQRQQEQEARRRPPTAPLCLCQVEVSGWSVRVSWRNVQHVLPFQLPENLLSVSDLCLSFSAFSCDGRPAPVEALAARVASAYRADVLWQMLGVVGAVDLLGNPAQLVRDVSAMTSAFCATLPFLRPPSPTQASVWQEAALLQRNARSLVFGTAGSLASCAATFLFAFTEVVKGLECQLSAEFSTDAQAIVQRSSGVPRVLSLRGGLNDARVALERAVRQSIAGALSIKTAAGWVSSCRAGLNVNLQLLLLARDWLLAANTLHPGLPAAIGSRTPPEALPSSLLLAPAQEEDKQRTNEELQALLPEGERLLLHCAVTLVTVQYGTRIRHERVLALAQRTVLFVSTGRVTMRTPLEQIASLENRLDGLQLSLGLKPPGEPATTVEMEFHDAGAKARFVTVLTQRFHQLTGRLLHHHKRLPEIGLLQ